MAISTSILTLILFLFCSTTNNAFASIRSGTHRKAASELSPLDKEANAIASSNWWSNQNNISNRCCWPGIECNKAGSITKISVNHSPMTKDCSCKINLWVLPNLVHLDLSEIGLCGNFPEGISGLKKLTHLNLSHNYLSGELPSTLANLTQLVVFDISYNYLSGPFPHELSMLEKLVTLDLSVNSFTGSIPLRLSHMTSLTHMSLSNNQLDGELPSTFANLSQLKNLNLSQNRLDGELPITFANLTQLKYLVLSYNQISGFVPQEIGKLTNLLTLDLSSNHLVGSIPEQIGNLNRLTSLHLDSNRINGSIPSNIGLLTHLEELTISDNLIDGCIPIEIEHLVHLKVLDLSTNAISGVIPPAILIHCSYVALCSNNLSGSIPSQIGNNLSYLDLNHNKLSGKIPKGLAHVRHYSLDCNLFSDQYYRKCYLHDDQGHRFRPSFVLVIIVVVVLIFFGCIGIAICIFRAKHPKCRNKATKHGDLFSIWNYDGKIAFEDIIEATEDFDIRYCIGTGAYGSVYRAQLPSGKSVALKKLHRSESESPTFYKSFCNEVEVLTQIRHRNIISLYGYCLHNRCMFLVYEYLERGSLFCNLANDAEAQELNWSRRVNIIKGTAHALAYMHHHCTPPYCSSGCHH